MKTSFPTLFLAVPHRVILIYEKQPDLLIIS